jgi:hypothetical protein
VAERTARLAEIERLWPQRDEPARRRELIGHLEAVTTTPTGTVTDESEGRYNLLVRLSRALYLEGTETKSRKDRAKVFERGMLAADGALYTFPAFRESFEQTGAVEQAVKVLGTEAIDAIYWNSVNLGKWARSEGLAKILMQKDKVKAMVEHVASLDPTFVHGATDRYFGAYYAALPAIGGQNLPLSKEHFDRALTSGPDYLGNLTLMAEYYALARDDGPLYKRCLDVVIASPTDTLPGLEPEQRMARRSALTMLENIEDRFDPDDLGGEPIEESGGENVQGGAR